MNIKSLVRILLTTTVVGLVATTTYSCSNNNDTTVKQSSSIDEASAYPKDRVSFYCGEIQEQTSGETIPATVAYVPQEGKENKNISIIVWKSAHIPEWQPQKRCDTVSEKFQQFYQDGRLNYLTTGVKRGYDIICAARDIGKPCQDDAQLFQVKASDNPQAVLQELIGMLESSSSNEPLYQSSEQQVYVSMEVLFEVAPAIKAENLTSN